VPWIAFLDTRETTTAQKGVYCVYLFREDMSGVYVTLNQGVTGPTEQLKWAGSETMLRDTAARLRPSLGQLADDGFALRDDIDLRTRGALSESFEVSTIAYKLYEAGRVPGDEDLLDDLENLLAAYQRYVDGKAGQVTPPPQPE